MTLPYPQRVKLMHILGMLGSEFAGERAAAGLLATQLLRQHNLTWHDLLSVDPEPSVEEQANDWRSVATWCMRNCAGLSQWETDFLKGLMGYAHPSDKQLARLNIIAAKIGSPATA